MTGDRDLDLERLLDQWFAVGADRAPEAAVEYGIELALATPQVAPLPPALGWRDLRAALRAPGMRLATALVIGLLMVIAVAAFIGSRPSVVTFTSSRYGYAVEIPSDWATIPAASAWRVTTAWDVEPVADVLRRGGLRFTAVSAPVIGAPRLERWADVFVPDRAEIIEPRKDPHCLDPTGLAAPLPMAVYRGWEPARISGRDALVRVACGYVDAVVLVEERAYVLSMFTGRQALADLAAFDAIIRTIRFTPPTPTPSPTTPVSTATPSATVEPPSASFRSSLYDYTIALPPSSTLTPATVRWDGKGPVGRAPMADLLLTPRRMTIASTDLPIDMAVETWLVDHVPPPTTFRRDADGSMLCRFGGLVAAPAGEPRWTEGDVGGRPAWIRSACGTIDAVIGIGDRVVVIRFDTGRQPDADRPAFDAIAGGIRFDEGATDGLRPLRPDAMTAFVSTRHGYTAQVPWRWRRVPATGTATPPMPIARAMVHPAFDRFDDGKTRRIWVASAPLEDGQTIEAWVATVPERRDGAFGGFDCPSQGGAAPHQPWRPTSVGGRPALQRSACSFVDVAVAAGGRVYVFTAIVIGDAAQLPASRTYLDELLATVQFTPETALDD